MLYIKFFHAIKLAEALKQQLPQYNFVPVYFMGSEDADLEELNHITIDQKNMFGKQSKPALLAG
jgi:uncharacterized protein YllA (UPF0747 family)